jgi:hypothetical protein
MDSQVESNTYTLTLHNMSPNLYTFNLATKAMSPNICSGIPGPAMSSLHCFVAAWAAAKRAMGTLHQSSFPTFVKKW